MSGYFISRLPEKARRLLSIVTDVKPTYIEEDGGPGSGNWSHKGRPGKRGGSGKGGGKQYRGGREDILYTGSRHDWLNGLKGEKQHEAQQFMENMRGRFVSEEDLKKTAEQCVMEESGPLGMEHREQMLKYMSEARSWDEHAQ